MKLVKFINELLLLLVWPINVNVHYPLKGFGTISQSNMAALIKSDSEGVYSTDHVPGAYRWQV